MIAKSEHKIFFKATKMCTFWILESNWENLKKNLQRTTKRMSDFLAPESFPNAIRPDSVGEEV